MQLRSNFWITKYFQVAKKVIQGFMHAKNLKDYRLNQYQLYLFQNVELKKKDPSTGIDYCGPIYIKTGIQQRRFI